MSEADEAAIHQVFAEYNDAFARDSAIAATFWCEPVMVVLLNEVIVLNSRADLEEFFGEALARLKSLGYSHGKLGMPRVKMLNSTTALYGVIVNRMKTDGTVLEQLGLSYLFLNITDGWKIIELIVPDSEKLINPN